MSSLGTCFDIDHFLITLDCQGHTINYTISDDGQGAVYLWYVDFFTLKNCKINQKGVQHLNNEPIHVYESDDIHIDNVTIDAVGMAIGLIEAHRANVTNVNITTETKPAIDLTYVVNSSFTNNYLHTISADAMLVYDADNSIINDNIFISDTRYGLSVSKTTNLSITGNYLETRSENIDSPLRCDEETNILEDNVLITP